MPQQIVTDRLVLRPFDRGDGNAVVAVLGDFAVARWLARVPHPFTHADLRLSRDDGASRWPGLAAITLDGAVIGGIGSAGHLGYWLAPALWGRGYATEAARAVVDRFFASGEAETLESGFFEGNAASRRVLDKLGFVETERYMFFNRALGREAPNVDMVLTRAGWEAAR